MLLKTTLPILVLAGAAAADSGYVQHNLVSDLAGMTDHTDTNLAPWWVNANGTEGKRRS